MVCPIYAERVGMSAQDTEIPASSCDLNGPAPDCAECHCCWRSVTVRLDPIAMAAFPLPLQGMHAPSATGTDDFGRGRLPFSSRLENAGLACVAANRMRRRKTAKEPGHSLASLALPSSNKSRGQRFDGTGGGPCLRPVVRRRDRSHRADRSPIRRASGATCASQPDRDPPAPRPSPGRNDRSTEQAPGSPTARHTPQAPTGWQKYALPAPLCACACRCLTGLPAPPAANRKGHDRGGRTMAATCDRVSSNVLPAVSTTCAVVHGS